MASVRLGVQFKPYQEEERSPDMKTLDILLMTTLRNAQI